MQHSIRHRCLAPAVMAALVAACVHLAAASEITRERAIDIARSQASFPITRVTAVKTAEGGRRVWRVTFRGKARGQPPALFEIRIVDVDRRTGAIVSVSRS